MSVDSVGDFLTIIRNGVAVSKRSVVAPYSHLKEHIAEILKKEGFITDYAIEGDGPVKYLKIFLKYKGGESAIHEIVRVSTPGCRAYRGCNSLKPIIGGLGISILTTSHGVITQKEAKKLSVGGEIICTVW